ncbi:MAG: tRNA (guanine-N(7)-)-methyltransferase [Bacteroidia bacterium]|jgi:tRNA (guanine-N7-)-methyltransferase|nr:MAG: tRNA (guanine-N(7)-)-methyltransferase [Bacteroidia bacterium]
MNKFTILWLKKQILENIETMGRKKLERFAQNQQSWNVVEAGKPFYEACKGKWHSDFFKNTNPIVLELACGRGEYSVGMAKVFPNKNFIGVDIKGSRLWKGSQEAMKENLNNVGFLRTYIQNLENFFAPQEVAEIWLIHPDPRPKEADARRRLTHPRFLQMYRNLLQKEGWLHLKTDNTGLFEYTLEVLQEQKIKNLHFTKDLYASEYAEEHFGIKTKYELLFEQEGEKIKYLKFQFA